MDMVMVMDIMARDLLMLMLRPSLDMDTMAMDMDTMDIMVMDMDMVMDTMARDLLMPRLLLLLSQVMDNMVMDMDTMVMDMDMDMVTMARDLLMLSQVMDT